MFVNLMERMIHNDVIEFLAMSLWSPRRSAHNLASVLLVLLFQYHTKNVIPASFTLSPIIIVPFFTFLAIHFPPKWHPAWPVPMSVKDPHLQLDHLVLRLHGLL